MHKGSAIRFGFTIAAFVLFMAAPIPAATYFASAGGASFLIGPCNGTDPNTILTTVTSSTPASVSTVCGPNGGSIVAAAASSQGHLGLSVTYTGFAGGQGTAEADFSTEVTFTTIDPNAPQTPISIALNMSVAGLLSATGSVNAGWFATAQIASTPFFYSTTIDGTNPPTHGVTTLSFTSGGEVIQPALDTVAGVLTTPFVAGIALNTPVFVKISLNVTGFGNPGGWDAVFPNSLDFPSGIDVFTLPDGYTANSPEALLVNNRFLGADSVPEPSTWAPLCAGLLWLARRKRARR